MLQSSEARISAAPPQSPQYFVYTVRAGARACVTPITTNCGDCGGRQLLCRVEAGADLEDLTRSPGHLEMGSAWRPGAGQ
jgi:hypothetical protein